MPFRGIRLLKCEMFYEIAEMMEKNYMLAGYGNKDQSDARNALKILCASSANV